MSLFRSCTVSSLFDSERGETARSLPSDGIGVVLARLRSQSSTDGSLELSLSLSLLVTVSRRISEK